MGKNHSAAAKFTKSKMQSMKINQERKWDEILGEAFMQRMNKKHYPDMKKETTEMFLARGGSITQCKPYQPSGRGRRKK